MRKSLDRRAIAARIRELIGPTDRGLLETAARLKLPEAALRLAVHDTGPHPTLEVLAAIVREYGVDPSWLLYGKYDQRALERALEAGIGFTESELVSILTTSDPGEREQLRQLERRRVRRTPDSPEPSG
jgi:hypothetical protein